MTKRVIGGLDRRKFVGGAAFMGGLVAMPAVLRAQQLKWIGASATAPTDFIAIALDTSGKRLAASAALGMHERVLLARECLSVQLERDVNGHVLAPCGALYGRGERGRDIRRREGACA